MLKLIQLEFRKNRLGGYLKGVLIANAVIILLAVGIMLIEKVEETTAFSTYAELLTLVQILVQVTFVVFAAVLIAKLVIEEYKNKTITVMFSYPINRKKLLTAKLSIVFVFTLITIIISNIVTSAAVLFAAEQFVFISDTLSQQLLYDHFWSMLINALTASGISLIPVYFGMLKKSIPATIISGFLVITIISSNHNGFSLSSFFAVPLAFAFLGLFLAYLSIRNVEKTDVI